uniref:ABC transmembrane type-1 domain-containing protein n=1 Tax=Megaselia scalaris TaxID=36166 RepID=T1H0W7_MEGSC
MFLFWFSLVIFSIPQCITEVNDKSDRILEKESNPEVDHSWLEYKYTSFMVYFSLIICSLLFASFSDKKPLETKYPRKKMDCPQTQASFLSRITYQWFDAMAWKGYKKPLEENDLWDLKAEDQSKEIMPVFAKHWNSTVQSNKADKSVKSPLVEDAKKEGKVYFDNPKATKQKKQSSVLPAICKSFAGIFLFGAFLELIKDILTFASPEILKLTIGFVEKKYSNDQNVKADPVWKGIIYALLLMLVVGMRVRTALINAIYRKALVVSNATRKESTVGEIVNLMAVDAQRFQELTLYINMIWSAPLQIALALYFLWNILGPSVLAGLGVMIIMIPINGWIAGRTKKLQVSQMKQKDNRVKLMNEILSGMKVLKLYAWEPSFEKQVLGIRSKEIETLRGAAHLNAATFFLWTFAPFLVSLVTFATYVLVDENNDLDATTAFVSLSLFNILRMPLMMLPMMITNMIQTQVSVNRINKFMNSEELDPNNVQHDPKYAKTPVLIEDGSFSWGDGEVCIKNINISADKGSLVAVVGTVGSGKTL